MPKQAPSEVSSGSTGAVMPRQAPHFQREQAPALQWLGRELHSYAKEGTVPALLRRRRRFACSAWAGSKLRSFASYPVHGLLSCWELSGNRLNKHAQGHMEQQRWHASISALAI